MDDRARGLTLQDVVIRTATSTLIAIDTHIAPGEVLTVMGPSGAGKSTLLSLIIGTLAGEFTATGRILLDGTDITDLRPDRRRVGILFQDDLLFPHLSVGANLAFGLTAEVTSHKARRARVSGALEEIGMAGFEDRDPATLSGGQKARVALMRMLLSEPCALLLDEPFSRLDAALRDQIRELVFGYARRRGLATLLVTHDREDARAAGGRVIDIAA